MLCGCYICLMYICSTSGLYWHCMTCYAMKCWKRAITLNSALYTSYVKLLEWLRRHQNVHTAASNTKPAAYKTQPPMGQSRTIVGRENTVHYMQTTHTYNAPKPEQKNVQVRDSSTSQSTSRNLCHGCLRGKAIAWTSHATTRPHLHQLPLPHNKGEDSSHQSRWYWGSRDGSPGLLRTGPHGILIQNWDIAGTSKEDAMFMILARQKD